MDSTGRALLNLLFKEGEHICVANDHFACKSLPLQSVLENDWVTLVSNRKEEEQVPDKEVHTQDLILVSVNPMKPDSKRLDTNASAFRTFLVEIDTGTLKEQINTIEHIKMPFSAQIFSGGKSIHTVITLDEDLPNERAYRYIAKWIFNIISSADPNCVNPSRCVRIPGAYRNGKKQRLRVIKGPVNLKDLKDWLNKYQSFRPVVKSPKPMLTGEFSAAKLSKWVFYNLKKGIDFKKGRSNTWFALAVDFAKAGYSEDKTIDVLQEHFQEEHDFKEKEWLRTIASAFNYVRERE